MATVYVGIGSNVGDRQANIDRALALLKEHEDIDIVAVSSVIETDVVDAPPQGKFLNAAMILKTDLMPLDLLSQLKMVERRLGRTKPEHNAPRTMDLDILFYDDVVILDGKSLKIPHPNLAERAFVLKPLAEIAPDFVHPRLGKTIKELLDALENADSSSPSRA